jgi:hypothetical protein
MIRSRTVRKWRRIAREFRFYFLPNFRNRWKAELISTSMDIVSELCNIHETAAGPASHLAGPTVEGEGDPNADYGIREQFSNG